MKSNWKYTKGNPDIAPYNRVNDVDNVPQINQSVNLSKVASSYKKQEAYELPKSFVVIFSGGRITEMKYFKIICDERKFPNIRIETFVEENFKSKGEPLIFEFALNKTKEYKESEIEEKPDKYYVVTDIDNFGQYVIANKQICDSNGIHLIVSNPCFEVWLYYSKHTDRFENFNEPADKSKLSGLLKKWVNSSVKGGLNPNRAIFDIESNIINAEQNLQYDIHNLPDKYSTDMFILAKSILPFIKTELDKIKSVEL